MDPVDHFLRQLQWPTAAVRGNGPTAPRFGSLVFSTSGCQIGRIDPNGYGASSTYTVENDMA